MKRVFYFVTIIALLLALVPQHNSLAADPNPVYFVARRLIAAQDNDPNPTGVGVGWVFTGNDANFIYVKYQTKLGYWLESTHLHVADTWEEIPQNNGNPTPGQFDYQGNHPFGTTVVEYAIPIGDWGPGDSLAAAAHAVVRMIKNPDFNETGWGVLCGDLSNPIYQFPGSNWAMWFPIEIR